MAGELENGLKEATAEDSRQMLEEFLKAFFFDNQPGISDPELEQVTFQDQMTK